MDGSVAGASIPVSKLNNASSNMQPVSQMEALNVEAAIMLGAQLLNLGKSFSRGAWGAQIKKAG